MSADDVFVHPAKWQTVSRATAVAVYWRVPIAVVPDGQSGGASWFDEVSPFFHGASATPLENLRYYRYRDKPPQMPGLPALGPSPDQSSAEQPPVEEQKFWINIVVVDEFGDFVPGVGVSVTGPGGAKGGGTTDAKGRAVVSNLKSGKAKVSLGKHLFFKDKSGAGTAVKPEEVSHTLTAVESLGGVARKYGTTDGRSIYYYPGNSALKGKRAALGLVEPKDTFKVPKSYVFEFPTKPDGEAHEYTLEVPAMLDITKCDPHFASSKETLDIQYDIALLKKQKVVLEISSPHLDGGSPLFKKELSATAAGPDVPLKTDGSHTFKWDGKANEGKIKGKHISPLYSPYKVKLYVDGKAQHTDERQFEVLYHSLSLHLGSWTPDDKEPTGDDKKIAAWYLNKHGYWAGPVGANFDNYLTKAIKHYKFNHPKWHKDRIGDLNDSIDADLKTALSKGERAQPWLDGAGVTNENTLATIWVDTTQYEELAAPAKPWDEYVADRWKLLGERRNRPMLPLEAEVLLVSKNVGPKGQKHGVSAPRGVGPVRVTWKHEEIAENPKKTQYAFEKERPTRAVAYLKKTFAQKSGGGTNCHVDFGGIRENDAAKNYKTPFELGAPLEPFEVKDEAGKAVYTHAHADDTKHPSKLGRAGVWFRPSFVAGDTYRVIAEIEFKKDAADLPNKADLEKRHGLTAKTRIRGRSGIMKVKHRAKVAVLVNWPASPKPIPWDTIRDEYSKAYIDLDTTYVQKTASQAMTNADFGTTVNQATGLANNFLTLNDDYIYGRALPAQQPADDALTYWTLLNQKINLDFWGKNDEQFYWDLRRTLSKNLRAETSTLIAKPGPYYTRGAIVIFVRLHKPVTILNHATNDPTPWKTDYTWGVSSMGMPDFVALIANDTEHGRYSLVAHELGHCLYLRHWKTQDAQWKNGGGDTPDEHDNKDLNCTMSYARSSTAAKAAKLPHIEYGKYKPHFCGKCVLKLRGWKVNAGNTLPKKS